MQKKSFIYKQPKGPFQKFINLKIMQENKQIKNKQVACGCDTKMAKAIVPVNI